MIKWRQAKNNTTARSVVYADTSQGRFGIIGNYYMASGATMYTVTLDTRVLQRNIRNFVDATRIAEAHLTMLKEGKKT